MEHHRTGVPTRVLEGRNESGLHVVQQEPLDLQTMWQRPMQTVRSGWREKKPCTNKNIVYESECGRCNPPGSRKVADREGLGEKRDVASLYVGESARSLHERAGETGGMQRVGKRKDTWLSIKLQPMEGRGILNSTAE